MITKTGTTIVGLCCQEGVILGADTRSTGGALVVDKNKLKIHHLSSRIYCCGAGTSADCEQLTRKTRKLLALALVELELSGEYDRLNSIASAIQFIANEIGHRQNGQQQRKPSAVFIIGGIDETGPKLYQIDGDGCPVSISYGSLGSGSADALAILETACRRKQQEQQPQLPQQEDQSSMPFTIAEGLDIVRQAVQAGIKNDLGSGSHVDLCVIRREKVEVWRERALTHRPSPFSPPQDPPHLNDDKARAALSEEVGNEESNDGEEGVLGRKVWSRSHLVQRLVKGRIVQQRVSLDPSQESVDIAKV
eukprot:scaffold1287_cov253-Ochromonas_danica.AAC.19